MEKYGHLTILKFVGYRNGHRYAECQCDCGNKKVICYSNIKRGLTKSCGCKVKTANGLSKTRLYQIYKHIKHRCFDKKVMAVVVLLCAILGQKIIWLFIVGLYQQGIMII